MDMAGLMSQLAMCLYLLPILMYKGALQLWTVSLFWKKGLGAKFPVVQNMISRGAYVQM